MAQMSYTGKPSGYFGNVRRELIDEVPIGSNAVLEVGCGEGNTGKALKAESRAQWVTGIELFESAAQKATYVLDQVITGNIEHIDLPFVEGQFDTILMGDVLEHLVDPWAQVKRLVSYLSPNGVLVASLPNVRNWRVIVSLIFLGKWDYQNFGILDKTHLRFFTRKSIIELFEENGLSIKKIVPLGEKSKVISRLHVDFLSEFAAPQYLVVCNRKSERTRVR